MNKSADLSIVCDIKYLKYLTIGRCLNKLWDIQDVMFHNSKITLVKNFNAGNSWDILLIGKKD